jgi:hypothetical protein
MTKVILCVVYVGWFDSKGGLFLSDMSFRVIRPKAREGVLFWEALLKEFFGKGYLLL